MKSIKRDLEEGVTEHRRQIALQGESLWAFRKRYNRIPYKLEASVDVHRKCQHKTWIDGHSYTCRIASIEHEDKRIGHVFVF